MPIITIEGPKIDIEKKRKLSSGLAEAASVVYGLPIEKIIVLIRENPPENVFTGGELLHDRWQKQQKA
ncbi:MAG TPA: 4-oxalocrotonate tautomerase DmpI [Acidobacteriota bacterium]|nr:4-oxalocrotonate tautomerase DmpI [Acidobacteriota bacterium]